MAIVDRPTADYFRWLGQADEREVPEASDHLVRAVFPAWAQKPDPIDEIEETDGSPITWDHLSPTEQRAIAEEEEPENNRRRVQSLLDVMLASYDPDHVDSPLGVISDNNVAFGRSKSFEIKDEVPDDALSRVRAMGKRIAKREGASNPRYQHSEIEGVEESVLPLPGTSFAWAGVRGSVGRHETVHAKLEADRLFDSGRDRRHGTAIADTRAAPLSARAAREMVAGERYKVTTNKATYIEGGLKYTPTPLGAINSSPIHDLGFSGKVELKAGVEGETTVEVMRGFGSKVSVLISARDDRVRPGRDRGLRAIVGGFLDGSWPEYVAHAFKKLAGRNMESELQSIEDQRRKMDLKILPHIEKLNEHAAAFVEFFREKQLDEHVTLYEVVFDLSKSDARRAFNKLTGAGWRGGKPIDFTAIADLDDKKGIEVISNNVRSAAHTGIRRAFGLFGLASGSKERIEENATTHEQADGKKLTITERNRGVVTNRRVLDRAVTSTTIGRARTIKDEGSGDTHTEIGFGWRYKLDAKHASARETEALITFAAEAGDADAKAKLERLTQVAETLPRRRFLGLSSSDGDLGKTTTELALDLDGPAVRRLLGMLDGADQESALWRSLAAAFARQHGLSKPPEWPVAELDKSGPIGWLRRAVRFSAADNAFVAIRNAFGLLRQAAEESDPIQAAQHLSRAFDQLNDDLAVAGALVACARAEDGAGVTTHFGIEGADNLTADAKPAPEPEVVPEDVEPVPQSA